MNLIKNDKEEKFSIPKDVRLVLAENLNKTMGAVTEISKQHNALVAKHGKKDDKGSYVIDPAYEQAKVFFIEKQDFLESASEVESLETVNYADLPEGVTIDLLALLLRTGMLVK